MLETTQQIINGFLHWNQFLYRKFNPNFSLEMVFSKKKTDFRSRLKLIVMSGHRDNIIYY